MQSSKRIILNTAASYGNSVVAIIFALFSTRWILLALGQADFGIYGVVGSIILLITYISATLSIGVARFYAYSIGQGAVLSKEESTEELKRWFNTALSMHLVLPILLIGIGWPAGEYAIQNWLTVPLDRLDACLWVFRASLVSAFMSVLAVPFVAMYTAHQRIFELALFGLLRTFSVFAVSWYLLTVSSDRLIFYAICMMTINTSIPLIQIIRAVFHYDACRVKFAYMYNTIYLKKLFQYVGWKMFGMSCYTLRAQGTPILVNLQFGPLVNAAYNLAFALSTQATALSTAMTQAFQPAIVSAEGSGSREKMLSMAMQACKFGSLLVLLFTIPLILEMETLLKLWLKTPPEYAGELCQWMLSMLVVDRITGGHMLAVNARGKIAAYELVQGTVLFLALPLMWAFFHFGHSPISIGYALFISMVTYCIGRVLFAKFLLDFQILQWAKQVLFPIVLLVVVSSLAGYLVMSAFEPSLLRLVLTSILTGIVTSVIGWVSVFDRSERVYVWNGIQQKLFKRTASKIG
jgi:O-antigen/teichoic acid export membrane protein